MTWQNGGNKNRKLCISSIMNDVPVPTAQTTEYLGMFFVSTMLR